MKRILNFSVMDLRDGGRTTKDNLFSDVINQGRFVQARSKARRSFQLQKGGVPATPSGTATLLRLSPS